MNANSTRSLTASTLAAALQAHRQLTLEEIQEIPTAQAGEKFFKLLLTCQYTGVNCGSLTLPTVAGYLPLLGQWKTQQVLHPLFSLDPIPLLKFSKNTWIRFCGFSAEEAADEHLTTKQEQVLRIAALAMLHQLTEVRQDIPWLPSFIEVQNNWQSLISLSYWRAYLDSQRFKFPTVRISKLESSINLNAFLQTCWEAKKSYETTVSERIEEEKVALAERALIGVRDELAGKRPLSQKLLWRWYLANLPARYLPDSEGWMKTLFFAKSVLDTNFTMADLDLFEEIFLSECPTGSSVSYAFLEVLRSKRTVLENHFEAFEILVPNDLQSQSDAGEISEVEPKLQDFEKKVHWLIAHAKWQLIHGSNKHRESAKTRQEQITVKPSFIPRLDTGRSKDFADVLMEQAADLDETDDIDYVAPDSVAASLEDDVQAESGNLEE